jgi:hypothetical protein
VLAAVGLGLLLVWGLLVLPTWHDEYLAVRLAGCLVLIGAAATVLVPRLRRWSRLAAVVGAGILGLWLISLIAGHAAEEYVEFFSPRQDGVTNLLVAAGAGCVVAAAWRAGRDGPG